MSLSEVMISVYSDLVTRNKLYFYYKIAETTTDLARVLSFLKSISTKSIFSLIVTITMIILSAYSPKGILHGKLQFLFLE